MTDYEMDAKGLVKQVFRPGHPQDQQSTYPGGVYVGDVPPYFGERWMGAPIVTTTVTSTPPAPEPVRTAREMLDAEHSKALKAKAVVTGKQNDLAQALADSINEEQRLAGYIADLETAMEALA